MVESAIFQQIIEEGIEKADQEEKVERGELGCTDGIKDTTKKKKKIVHLVATKSDRKFFRNFFP